MELGISNSTPLETSRPQMNGGSVPLNSLAFNAVGGVENSFSNSSFTNLGVTRFAIIEEIGRTPNKEYQPTSDNQGLVSMGIATNLTKEETPEDIPKQVSPDNKNSGSDLRSFVKSVVSNSNEAANQVTLIEEKRGEKRSVAIGFLAKAKRLFKLGVKKIKPAKSGNILSRRRLGVRN